MTTLTGPISLYGAERREIETPFGPAVELVADSGVRVGLMPLGGGRVLASLDGGSVEFEAETFIEAIERIASGDYPVPIPA